MGATHTKPSQDITLADRDAQILALKRQDLSFQQIADRLGISRAAAHRGFHRALPRITEPQATAYRAEHLARLELRREVVMDVLNSRHVTISNGHVISEIVGTDQETGKPIYGDPYEDDGVVMAASAELGRIDDQEAKLLGLYAKTETEHTGQLTIHLLGIDPADL